MEHSEGLVCERNRFHLPDVRYGGENIMLKAVVFDDEYIVLQGLRSMMDWQRFGIELVGTAGDGLTALKMLQELKPDIVLSDIRMPGMDGLTLIETAAYELPDTIFLIFSGFTEFEYVKRAIGLGVVDYVDKPITMPKIEAALSKAVERFEQQRLLRVQRAKWEAGREQLLEKAVLDLLLSGEQAVERLQEVYGPDWHRIQGITVLAFSAGQPLWREQEGFRIVNVTNGAEKLAAVFHYGPTEPVFDTLLLGEAAESRDNVGAGRTYTRPAEVPHSYREALRALRYGRFMGDAGWTRIEDIEGDVRMPLEMQKHEEAVIMSLRTRDAEGLERALDGFEVWVSEQLLDPEQTEQELLKLAYLGRSVVEEQTGSTGAGDKIQYGELSAMHARADMFGWLRCQLSAELARKKAVHRSARHPAVTDAIAYLEEKYGDDVSLQELAEQVGMNPTYFSLLFKEEMGTTYIKYLTQIRMERAKSMLREGLRVSEVSERVGYLNYRHFTELFKKLVGVTPGHYRESYQSGKQG